MPDLSQSHLIPLFSRVLLRKIEQSSRGGLTIPRGSVDAEELTDEYEVLLIGDAVNVAVRVGDRLVYPLDKRWKIVDPVTGSELYIANIDDALAIRRRSSSETEAV